MLHPVTFRTLALAACGWLLACDACALTVGRARGAVLVGRPLDLAIPVTLDSNETDAPCATGELFYGDQKLLRPPSVAWEPGPNRQGVLRVTSPDPVDEPIVTLYLRVGCGQSVTRRFVVLTELPPEGEPASTAARSAAAAGAPTVAAPQGAAPSGTPAARPGPGAAATAPAAPAAAPRRRDPVVAQASPPAPAAEPRQSVVRQRAAPAAPAGAPSRLHVTLLDPGQERDPTLRLSTEVSAPATDPKAREAAAALWLALQRTPDEILQEGLRLQTMEKDLQSLRAVTQENAAAVTRMRQQVQKAQAERNQVSGAVIALLVALAAVVAWMFWQWRRSRRLSAPQGGTSWFERAARTPAAPVPTQPMETDQAPLQPAGRAPAPTSNAVLRPAVAHAVAKAGRNGRDAEPTASEFMPSMGGTVRMVGVQELIDVHDKADFFLALGQEDQAIAVLEAHVHDQVETSALPWMDLLDLFHTTGRREQFEELRAEFRQRFAVQVPEFDSFDQPTSSLENYSRALSRIVALWPSRRVLNVIEESIFRKPGLPGAEPFSLEAYRELVLLYHIAQDVAPPEDSFGAPLEYRPTDFPSTSLQPLNTLDLPDRPLPQLSELLAAKAEQGDSKAPDQQATVVMGRVGADDEKARDQLFIPPSSPRIGLDINLGDDASAAPAAAPADGDSLRSDLPPLDFDTSGLDAGDDPARKGK